MDQILSAKNLKISFGEKEIISDFSYNIAPGKVYSILGPNGCGKTTLVRALSRNLRPKSGSVFFWGKNIFRMSNTAVARSMAVLSQTHEMMGDVSVQQLVSYGRYAHRSWWAGSTRNDARIIEEALEKTGLQDLKKRKITTLSGGEQQRAWIAMAIAQEPSIMILDEPTTFLDICHQLEILELISHINREQGITILMVLHDINHAVRFSHQLLVMKDGKLFATGSPGEVLSAGILEDVFRVRADIYWDPETGEPHFHAKTVLKAEL